MISDLFFAFAVLVSTPFILLLIMLVPPFLELKKPKDAGPRSIIFDLSGINVLSIGLEINGIPSIEDALEFQSKWSPTLVNVLGRLFDIEG